MKAKSNYTDQRRHGHSKKQSKVADKHDCKDFVENDRIEWLKQLYAEWLEKRNSILICDKETFQIYEPDEFNNEVLVVPISLRESSRY